MKLINAATALSALSQPSRLEVFRLLVKSGNHGLCAGDISKRLGIPKPTLSFHLKELTQAGLLKSERSGRSITYELDVKGMQALLNFLSQDCCQGRPEFCLPGRPSRPSRPTAGRSKKSLSPTPADKPSETALEPAEKNVSADKLPTNLL